MSLLDGGAVAPQMTEDEKGRQELLLHHDRHRQEEELRDLDRQVHVCVLGNDDDERFFEGTEQENVEPSFGKRDVEGVEERLRPQVREVEHVVDVQGHLGPLRAGM